MKTNRPHETLKAQAHRACATVAEVLGRDPKRRLKSNPKPVSPSAIRHPRIK